MIVEGARVVYIGHHRMLDVGDEGVALDVGNTGTHVRWVTGSRAGSIDLVGNSDLVLAENGTTPVAQARQARKDALRDGWGLTGTAESSIDDDELGLI